MKIFMIMTKFMKMINIIIPILLAVALLTLLERKVLGYIQLRKGPNLVGPMGMLQPMTDGLKLFMKENFSPSSAKLFMFFVSPAVFFFMAFTIWSVMSLPKSGLKLNLSILFVLAMSSLSVYSLLMAGWSSNSKYALLGSMRGIAQMMSYEVSLGLIVMPIMILMGGWNFNLINNMKMWLMLPCLPLSMMWFMSTLAETKRAPFDLTEGESELVSGYKVEYAGAPFALFFMGEYANMMLMKLLSVILFLKKKMFSNKMLLKGVEMATKTSILVMSFLWVRGSFPRIRYDQLMMLMWKNMLPLVMSLLTFYYIITTLVGNYSSYYY